LQKILEKDAKDAQNKTDVPSRGISSSELSLQEDVEEFGTEESQEVIS
jgi:hypothetical protein